MNKDTMRYTGNAGHPLLGGNSVLGEGESLLRESAPSSRKRAVDEKNILRQGLWYLRYNNAESMKRRWQFMHVPSDGIRDTLTKSQRNKYEAV